MFGRLTCSWPKSARRFYSLPRAFLFTGRATSEGTKSFFNDVSPKILPVPLPSTEWTVGKIGFSGCKLKEDDQYHKSSLATALSSFCNFVSVPASGEAVLAKAMWELFDLGEVTRDQLVIAIKMGIVREQHLNSLQRRFPESDIYNEHVPHHKYMYSISPEFLDFKLQDTLRVLDLECIDLVMLDDPVFNFLDENPGEQEEMYNRIERAFEHLEAEATRGLIQYYGISSDSFILPSSDPRHLSLERLLQIAKNKNLTHFIAIEYVHNIVENGAVSCTNNTNDTLSVSQLAKKNNFLQIGHRPLTIYQHGRTFRLRTLPKHEDRDLGGLMNDSFAYAGSLEKTSPVVYKEEIQQFAESFTFPDLMDVMWSQHFAANLVDGSAHYLYKYLNWVEFEARPRLEKALRMLVKKQEFIVWTVRYRTTMDALFLRCQWILESLAYETAEQFQRRLGYYQPYLKHLDLAHQGLRIAITEGPDIVLCGMRTQANLIHVSQLDQHLVAEPRLLKKMFKWQLTGFMETDDLYLDLETTIDANANPEGQRITFGTVDEGSIPDQIRKHQLANPIKSEFPIF